MQKFILTLTILFSIFAISHGEVLVTVSNTFNFARQSELVEIPITRLKAKGLILKGTESYIVYNKDGKVVPSQLTHDSILIFPCGLEAKASAKFTIDKGVAQQYTAKVCGIFFPQREDDFVWENDHVGFRFYGDALKHTSGPSNGLDLWYKRTSNLILQKWYERAFTKGIWFHKDRGEGCDPYAVGRSLGAGAMAPFINGKLMLNDNFLKQEIIDNGPLRFTAILTYPDFQVNGKMVSERRIVSLDAGNQLTAITEDYGKINIPVAAGFVKHTQGDSVISQLKSKYFIYEEPKTKENGQIFLGIYIPTGIDSVCTTSYKSRNPIDKKESYFTHTLGISKYKSQPLTYYTGFGWEKFGFPTINSFQEYMNKFILCKRYPLKIKISRKPI